MPVRRGNHRLSGAEGISQRTGGDLRLVEVRRNIQIRCADELFEIVKVYELVIEDDVLIDIVLLGEDFKADPVSFTVFPQFVRMRGPEDNIDYLWEFRQNFGQSIQCVF